MEMHEERIEWRREMSIKLIVEHSPAEIKAIIKELEPVVFGDKE